MPRIRVLIADDQELFASGLEIILTSGGNEEFAVIGKAVNGKEAVAITKRQRPDVILMDVRMPVMDGVEATRIICERFPASKILILTTFDDDQYVVDALNNGALGYVLKNVSPQDLITSIKAVHSGNLIVSPSVGMRLVRRAEGATMREASMIDQYRGELNYLMSCFGHLTEREAEILHLIMLDHDNAEIAARLCIAEQTVKNHVSSIYSKLDVTDRVHAKRAVNRVLARHAADRE